MLIKEKIIKYLNSSSASNLENNYQNISQSVLSTQCKSIKYNKLKHDSSIISILSNMSNLQSPKNMKQTSTNLNFKRNIKQKLIFDNIPHINNLKPKSKNFKKTQVNNNGLFNPAIFSSSLLLDNTYYFKNKRINSNLYPSKITFTKTQNKIQNLKSRSQNNSILSGVNEINYKNLESYEPGIPTFKTNKEFNLSCLHNNKIKNVHKFESKILKENKSLKNMGEKIKKCIMYLEKDCYQKNIKNNLINKPVRTLTTNIFNFKINKLTIFSPLGNFIRKQRYKKKFI
jgi:hypothetical protein